MIEFPQDVAYRKQLLENAGLDPKDYYKLRSIIGIQELKSIMREFSEHEEFYSAGINDENVKNATVRANMHIHTRASDGFFSTQELLDMAAEYANKAVQNPGSRKTPFVIGITDHDTADSAKEAIQIISKNPEKYKNLRVILELNLPHMTILCMMC